MQTPVTAYVKLSEDKPLEAKFIQKKKKNPSTSFHFPMYVRLSCILCMAL